MRALLIILSTSLLLGCADKRADEGEEIPIVFTSILPQAGLVKAIAGDFVQAIPLVGEGQSPHSYEPSAKQLAKLGEADALLTIGIPFETTLIKKIKSIYPNLAVIESQTGISLRSMAHASHEGPCDHAHGENDPHVWLAPLTAKQIAENSCLALIEIDPSNANHYRLRFEALARELVELDTMTKVKLAPFVGERVYVFHPSFGYFTDAYGLEQVPIELDGKTPSPRQLADLIEQAQVDGVKVIFVQKQFPVGSAEAVANAIGGRVVTLDPLAEDVVANLRKIADSIVQALEQ